jgi:hypothetical protein
MTDQQSLIARAAKVLPGGVLGSHRAAPGLEFVVKDARGPYRWDVDGRRYIDCLLGSGPMLLGQCLRRGVVKAVNKIYVSLADRGCRRGRAAGRVRRCAGGRGRPHRLMMEARRRRPAAGRGEPKEDVHGPQPS